MMMVVIVAIPMAGIIIAIPVVIIIIPVRTFLFHFQDPAAVGINVELILYAVDDKLQLILAVLFVQLGLGKGGGVQPQLFKNDLLGCIRNKKMSQSSEEITDGLII